MQNGNSVARRSIHTGAAAIVLFFTSLVFIKLLLPGGLTQFGGFGELFSERYIPEIHAIDAYIKPDSGGYDGQFYAQLATDPTLNNPAFQNAIDEPAYRARRIFLPFLSYVLALGHPAVAIYIYCSLNIFFWYAFAWIVWRWLEVSNWRDFAKWVACVLSMGVMDSVKYSLTDLPSIFVILIILRYAGGKRTLRSTSFIASLFLKETNLLALAAVPRLEGPIRNWIKPLIYWAGTGLLGIAVFMGWYAYINLHFNSFHGISGNFDWPLLSLGRNLWQAILEIASGNWDDRYIFRIISVVGFAIQVVFFARKVKELQNPLVRLGLIYGCLFLFLGDLVWWGYWAVCRVALPMTIAFNLLYDSKYSKRFWIGLVAANLTVIHSLYRFL